MSLGSKRSLTTRFGPTPLRDDEVAIKSYVDGVGVLKVVKSADETLNNDDTLQNDDELFMPLLANRTYGFMLNLAQTTLATANIQYRWTLPAGATGEWTEGGTLRSDAATTLIDVTDTRDNAPGDTALRMINVVGFIIMGGTAGNMQFQWSQQTATVGNTTVNQGSSLIVWEQ